MPVLPEPTQLVAAPKPLLANRFRREFTAAPWAQRLRELYEAAGSLAS